MKKIKYALIFLFAALMQTCEYIPKDVYDRPVSKEATPPGIQTVALDINYNDTIFLYTERNINFVFSSDNQEIKTVRFLIDNVEKYVVNSSFGTFTLSYGQLSDGEHSLVIEIYTGTGTNSIAELVGAERFLFLRSWKLFVDNSFYSRTRASISNGFLKLTWPKYRNYDFKEYVVSRVLGYNNEVVLKRLKSTEFVDSTYVGEGGNYLVRVDNQKTKLFDWGHIEISPELPELQLMPTEGDPFILKWREIKYYNAVGEIRLAQSLNSTNYLNVKTTQDPIDTTYVLETGKFADMADFKLRLVPKRINIMYTDPNYSCFESHLYGRLGFLFKKNIYITSLSQVAQDEFIYIYGCDSLIKYSISKKHTVDQLGYTSVGCSKCEFSNITFSASGKYITNYVNCNPEGMLVNSDNMHSYIVHDLKPYTGQNSTPKIPISDVGMAIVNKNNGGFVIYDFNTNAISGTFNGGSGSALSSNGKYIFLNDDSLRLVRFTNSMFTDIWSQSRAYPPKYYGFDGVNSEQLVIWDGTTFSVKRCNDFSNVYNFPLSDNEILDIDFYNNEILTSNPGHLYVKSYLDGSLIKDLPVTYTTGFYLINHAIISRWGLIYFIKQV